MIVPLPPPDIRTLDAALRYRAQVLPDQEFVRVGDSPWVTPAELDRRATAVARGLRKLNVAPGDRVATILPNRIEVLEIFFAVAKLGAVQVPLNYWLKGEFLRYQLADCGARVLIADQAGLAAAAPLLDRTDIGVLVAVDEDGASDERTVGWSTVVIDDDSPFEPFPSTARTLHSILYTSGTTGMPKGCMLGNGYFVNSGRVYHTREWIAPGDRLFTAWPLFHAAGLLNALCPALMTNASVHYEKEFHASTYLARAREVGATTLMGVGFMGNAILAQPPTEKDSEYRFKLAVFPPMAEHKQLEFERRFGTPVLCEGYGQTEFLPITASKVSGPRKRSTSGQIPPTVEVRIVDDDGNEVPDGTAGEITVRAKVPDSMFQGYWNKSEATLEAWRGLWHHTGDRGYKDADGFLTFVDRKKDAIRRRGENVSSFELEIAIAEHPDVAAVAVTAVPSPVGEDDIKASIVLKDGATFDPAAMFEFLKNNVPYYAIPRYIDIRGSLPTNAMGRVMKQVLRDEKVPDGVVDFEQLGFVVPRDQRRAVGAATR